MLLVAALLLVPGGGGGRGVDQSGSVGSPIQTIEPDFWTPERMAEAQPAPMPTAP